ncbi:putative RloB-like protein [Azospirillaceae bacterium]
MDIARKSISLERESTGRRPYYIVISSEDTYATVQYFSVIKDTRVKIKILETTDGRSAPKHVVERLREYVDDRKMNDNHMEGDQYWLTIDHDNRREDELLEAIILANRHRFHIAISNPSFEVWLLFHIDEVNYDVNSAAVAKQLLKRKCGGYNHTNIRPERFASGISDARLLTAVERARNRDTAPDKPWPDSPGTRVYRIIEEITKRCPEPYINR